LIGPWAPRYHSSVVGVSSPCPIGWAQNGYQTSAGLVATAEQSEGGVSRLAEGEDRTAVDDLAGREVRRTPGVRKSTHP